MQTLDSLHDLAILYKDLNRFREAICLLRSVIRYRSDVLGHQHRDTTESEAALQSLLRNVKANLRSSDAESESTLLTGLDFNLLSDLETIEGFDRADQASKAYTRGSKNLQRTLQEMSAIFGEDFPLTLDVSRRVALEMVVQGNQQDALPLFERFWRLQYSGLQGANAHAAKFLFNYVTCLRDTEQLENELSHSLKHAMTIAILTEHKPLFKLLVEAKVDLNVPCDDGSTPLLHATLLGPKGKKVISELLKSGAKQIPRNDGKLPLLIAFENCYDEIFYMLLDNGGDYEQCSSNDQSLLLQASDQGRPHIVHALLNAGADPSHTNPKGLAPIHVATLKGHLEIIKALIHAGASPTLVMINGGSTPMYIAAQLNQEKALEYLLSVGAEADTLSMNGFGPIHVAAEKNFVAIVNRLLDAGVSIEQISQNPAQHRPIHTAAIHGSFDVLCELVRRRAGIESVAGSGARALHFACECGNTAMVAFLLDAGAAVNVQTSNGLTPFYSAVLSGQVDILPLLLEKGKANPILRKMEDFFPSMGRLQKAIPTLWTGLFP